MKDDAFGRALAEAYPNATIGLVPLAINGVDIDFFGKGVVSSRRQEFRIPPRRGGGGKSGAVLFETRRVSRSTMSHISQAPLATPTSAPRAGSATCYLVQRPENHALHHQRGLHAHNYADFSLIDIVFGTFQNPEKRATSGAMSGLSRALPRRILLRPDAK